jgi:sarcosine oxidase subunit beta
MGTSTAYHLSRLGVTSVILAERDSLLGTGSTGRNAGGVRHQFSSEANIRLSIESIRLLERFDEEVGYPVDFHQDGYLFLLSREDSLCAFESNIQLQRSLGVEVSRLSPEAASELAPGLKVDGIIGATFCARDGIADPNGVTMGFAKAAQNAGIQILREAEVTGIKVSSGRVTMVETTRGDISTPIVVNATGAYASQIGAMVGLEIPVFPVRRHIFITESMIASMGISVPSSKIMVIDFDTSFYFHREGAGVLFGMADPDDEPSFDLTVSWEFLEEVTRVAIKRLPALADAGIAHAWAGLYEMTPDAMPIIGPAPGVEGFYLITGFSGHGFQHSPAAGRILAELIVNRCAQGCDPSVFAFDRFSGGRINPEITVV